VVAVTNGGDHLAELWDLIGRERREPAGRYRRCWDRIVSGQSNR
jgi:hypothetical protein